MEKRIKRIEKLCFELGINENELIKKSGISVGSFSYVRKNDTDVSLENLDRIIRAYPNVSRMWLLFGEGDMFDTNYMGDVRYNNNSNNNNNNSKNSIKIGGDVACNNNNTASDPMDNQLIADLTKAVITQQKITLAVQDQSIAIRDMLLRLQESIIILTEKIK